MDTLVETKKTVNELHSTIQSHLKELAQATDEARVSKEMVRYLEFCVKFHEYSALNIWLILKTKPEATYVAGFNAWKKLQRYVKRGEKGITILAPMFYLEDPGDKDSQKVLQGFRIVHVFDISQTDGQPLPEAPNWKSPEKNLELQRRLLGFAKLNGIQVIIKELEGETQGISTGGSIVLSPEAGTKTLIHELSHELLHQVEKFQLSRAEKEMEAESIAYVVCSYFGMTNLCSPNYLALHGLKSDMILTCFQRINNLAKKLIIDLTSESY